MFYLNVHSLLFEKTTPVGIPLIHEEESADCYWLGAISRATTSVWQRFDSFAKLEAALIEVHRLCLISNSGTLMFADGVYKMPMKLDGRSFRDIQRSF